MSQSEDIHLTADKTQVRMSSICGIPRIATHLFCMFVLSPSTRPTIFKDGRHVEGLVILSLGKRLPLIPIESKQDSVFTLSRDHFTRGARFDMLAKDDGISLSEHLAFIRESKV